VFLGFGSPQNGCTSPRINSRAARVSVKILCNSSQEAQDLAESRRGAGRLGRGNGYLPQHVEVHSVGEGHTTEQIVAALIGAKAAYLGKFHQQIVLC
jgi:hypothetical protein